MAVNTPGLAFTRVEWTDTIYHNLFDVLINALSIQGDSRCLTGYSNALNSVYNVRGRNSSDDCVITRIYQGGRGSSSNTRTTHEHSRNLQNSGGIYSHSHCCTNMHKVNDIIMLSGGY